METAKQDVLAELLSDVKTARSSSSNASENFLKLQYQLFIIASGTFSIYLAIKTTAPEGLIKWGFISLAGSLIFGLISIVAQISHEGWYAISKWIEIEKKIFGKDSVIPENTKRLFVDIGFPQFSTFEGTSREKIEAGIKAMQWLAEHFYPFSFWCGLIQLLLFLLSTILIFTGLFYI